MLKKTNRRTPAAAASSAKNFIPSKSSALLISKLFALISFVTCVRPAQYIILLMSLNTSGHFLYVLILTNRK